VSFVIYGVGRRIITIPPPSCSGKNSGIWHRFSIEEEEDDEEEEEIYMP